MRPVDVIAKANERGFVLVMGEDEEVPARISGSRLAFPMVHSECGRYSCEISWHLAERLARGESARVVY